MYHAYLHITFVCPCYAQLVGSGSRRGLLGDAPPAAAGEQSKASPPQPPLVDTPPPLQVASDSPAQQQPQTLPPPTQTQLQSGAPIAPTPQQLAAQAALPPPPQMAAQQQQQQVALQPQQPVQLLGVELVPPALEEALLSRVTQRPVGFYLENEPPSLELLRRMSDAASGARDALLRALLLGLPLPEPPQMPMPAPAPTAPTAASALAPLAASDQQNVQVQHITVTTDSQKRCVKFTEYYTQWKYTIQNIVYRV